MGSHQPIRKIVAPEIPDKLYFRIGDVARICEVPAYVLRFWETEFPQLKQNKGGTGQRLYRRRDVEMALRIKSLLYDQGYTIPGARQVFKAESTKVAEAKTEAAEAKPAPENRLTEIRSLQTKAKEASPQNGPLTFATPLPADPKRHSLSELRRTEQVKALRAEMAALVALLAKPAGFTARESNVQAMRPRLAVVEKPKSTQLSLDGDLF